MPLARTCLLSNLTSTSLYTIVLVYLKGPPINGVPRAPAEVELALGVTVNEQVDYDDYDDEGGGYQMRYLHLNHFNDLGRWHYRPQSCLD